MGVLGEQNGLPAEPFRQWLLSCGLGAYELSRLGLDHSYRKRILDGSAEVVSITLVDRVLTRAGWPLELVYPADDYPEDPRPAYCREYEMGASISELAARYHYSFESMRYRIRKEGVQMRPRGGRRGGAHHSGVAYDELALKAAQRRATGQTWVQVARELGYSTPQAAQRAVAYHLSLTSKDFKKPTPCPRDRVDPELHRQTISRIEESLPGLPLTSNDFNGNGGGPTGASGGDCVQD